MYHPPSLPPEPTHGTAALLGGVLGALLRALLGWVRMGGARRRRDSLDGVVAGVLAAQAAIDLAPMDDVEWECVPAPWRAGQLLPARHARALSLKLPCSCMPLRAFAQGPPRRGFTPGGSRTGMAQGQCAGDDARATHLVLAHLAPAHLAPVRPATMLAPCSA